MIKINLIAEKDTAKSKIPISFTSDGTNPMQTILLAAILIVGVVIAGGWWWSLSGDVTHWQEEHRKADQELERLSEVRKKGDQYKRQKALLARKIELITNLKKQQSVPVHILDELSRNLPEFLWLDRMTANKNQITISGKATTYNAVTKFYNNLSRSGYFDHVNLGRTFENSEGVGFSLTCSFTMAAEDEIDGGGSGDDEGASS